MVHGKDGSRAAILARCYGISTTAFRSGVSFIAMMVSCKVAFPLRAPSADDNEIPELAPDLLPDHFQVAGEITARFQQDQPDATYRDSLCVCSARPVARELMGTWGTEAGQHGLYWRDGLCFYDRSTKSRGLIEALRPEDRSWRGNRSDSDLDGEATTLMERLRAKVLEAGERFGAQIEPEYEFELTGKADEEDEEEDEPGNTGGWREEELAEVPPEITPPDLPIVPGPGLLTRSDALSPTRMETTYLSRQFALGGI